jgi:hypothetical protein
MLLVSGRSAGGRAGDPAGQLGELDPVGGAGLVQQVRDVHADRLLAEHQLAGDPRKRAPGDLGNNVLRSNLRSPQIVFRASATAMVTGVCAP